MGMTMTQKILAAHAGLPSVSAGQRQTWIWFWAMILLLRLQFMKSEK